MRLFSVLIACIFLTLPSVLNSTVTRTAVSIPAETHKEFTSLKVRDVEKLVGRKLTTKEKISFLILKHHAKKKAKGSNKGGTALAFGISGAVLLILGLFVPYVILGALAAAIVAVVLGSVAKKRDPSDSKARAAALLGWITLGAIGLLFIIAVIAVSTWY